MTTDGLIFDLDGTLVDSLPGIAAALNAVMAEEGFPTHPEEAVRDFIGNGLETTVRRACPEDTNDSQVTRLVDAFRRFYTDTWIAGTRPYPGISGLLAELHAKGVPLAVLSNKSHAFTEQMAAEIFPEIPFAAVLGLRPGMPPKPDAGGALEIACSLGMEPHQCCIIGDSTMDIETAKHAGMRSCAITWGYHDATRLIAAAPDSVVADVDALRGWISG